MVQLSEGHKRPKAYRQVVVSFTIGFGNRHKEMGNGRQIIRYCATTAILRKVTGVFALTKQEKSTVVEKFSV